MMIIWAMRICWLRRKRNDDNQHAFIGRYRDVERDMKWNKTIWIYTHSPKHRPDLSEHMSLV